MSSSPVFVLGAGPGIGTSVATRFAARGRPVGLVARNAGRLGGLARAIGEAHPVAVSSSAADLRDADARDRALRDLVDELGTPGIVVVCPLPDVSLIKPVVDTSTEDVTAAMDLTLTVPVGVVQTLLPTIGSGDGADLVFTTGGAAVAPSPDRAVSALTNVALATYCELLTGALDPATVRIHRVTMVGAVGPSGPHRPDDVAAHIDAQIRTRRHTVSILR